MKILVTGASGMVGRHVLELLQSQVIESIAASRVIPENVKTNWVQWDLKEDLSTEGLTKRFPDITAIIHVGSLVPKMGKVHTDLEYFDVNVRPLVTLTSWACAREIPLVFLSGATVYADPFKANIDEEQPLGLSNVGGFYGYSKLLAENVINYYNLLGLKSIILRPSSIYGFGLSDEKLICKVLKQAANNDTIHLAPPYHEKINLIHASDVAKAMLSALKSEAWGTYNIAGVNAYSVVEIAQCAIDVTGKGNIQIQPVITNNNDSNSNTNSNNNSIDTHDVWRYKYGLNSSKAKKAFGFKPVIDLTLGLQSILQKTADINSITNQTYHCSLES